MNWSASILEIASYNNFTIPLCGQMSEDSFNLLMAVTQAVAVPLNFFTLLVLFSLRSETGNGLVLCAASFWDLVCTVNCCLFSYATRGLRGSNVVAAVMFHCIVNSGLWPLAVTQAWLAYTVVAVWRYLVVTKPFLPEQYFTTANAAILQAALLLLGVGLTAPVAVSCYTQNPKLHREGGFLTLVGMNLVLGSIMVYCYARLTSSWRINARELTEVGRPANPFTYVRFLVTCSRAC